MKKFCITTLTHDAKDRGEALRYTVKTFMDDYKDTNKLDWFILVNVTNDGIDETLEWIQKEYSDRVNWNIEVSPVNTGVGGGINRLNAKTMNYKYNMFLEGDWMHIPSKYSGHSDDWINSTISFLDTHKEVDVVQLRRYLDDLDDRQYGYSYWVRDNNIEREIKSGKNTFVILNKREYTNPPTIRRTKAFFDKQIFPLGEYIDENGNSMEIKGNDYWGQAEIKAAEQSDIKNLKTAWLKYGNFIHFENWSVKDDWESWINSDYSGCKKYPETGISGCKYGYMTPIHFFCSLCKAGETLDDLEKHSQQHEQIILPLVHAMATKEEIFNKVRELNENPEINIDTYINYEEFIGPEYRRKPRQKD